MLTTADSLWIGVSIVESLAFAHTFSDPGESEPLWYRWSYPHFIHPIRYSVLGRTKLELRKKIWFELRRCMLSHLSLGISDCLPLKRVKFRRQFESAVFAYLIGG